MRRRRLLLLVAAALLSAAVTVSAASAVSVRVRVEGARTTIFGATEPRLVPFAGSIPVVGGAEVELSQPTPLGALEAASRAGEFYYALVGTSLGPYVAQIGRIAGEGSNGWAYKVNGVSPPVGADSLVLEDGDSVLWYYAMFGETGGPPTLDLRREGRGCFRAYSVDDAGTAEQARRVTFRVDGRRVFSAGGKVCVSGRGHELRATRAGAIRSELVRR